MLDVVKRQQAPRSSASTRTSRQGSSRARVGKNINVWLPHELVDAFLALCRQDRRTQTAEMELLLAEALAKRGVWPAK